MDERPARQRLTAERAEVAQLLKDAESAGTQDRDSEDEPGDYADAAQPLTAQGMDVACARAGLRDRLATIDTLLRQLNDRTFRHFSPQRRAHPDAATRCRPSLAAG